MALDVRPGSKVWGNDRRQLRPGISVRAWDALAFHMFFLVRQPHVPGTRLSTGAFRRIIANAESVMSREEGCQPDVHSTCSAIIWLWTCNL